MTTNKEIAKLEEKIFNEEMSRPKAQAYKQVRINCAICLYRLAERNASKDCEYRCDKDHKQMIAKGQADKKKEMIEKLTSEKTDWGARLTHYFFYWQGNTDKGQEVSYQKNNKYYAKKWQRFIKAAIKKAGKVKP